MQGFYSVPIRVVAMDRRTLLTAMVPLSGCISVGSRGEVETETPTPTAVNPRYIGLHEEHEGYEITNVTYTHHDACKATIRVTFDEKPPEDAVVVVVLYEGGEAIDAEEYPIGELGNSMTNNTHFPYCHFQEFSRFKIAVITPN